jgi:DNA polymerase-3 subunit alpha
MQKYMKELKPTVFPDLIAMNALYRPGPIVYIPSFVKRKTVKKRLFMTLMPCEELLKDTYGITTGTSNAFVPKLQISKGDADVLRKAMGKKQKWF